MKVEKIAGAEVVPQPPPERAAPTPPLVDAASLVRPDRPRLQLDQPATPIKTPPVAPVAGPMPAPLDEEQVASFVGRLASRCLSSAETQLLERCAAAGLCDASIRRLLEACDKHEAEPLVPRRRLARIGAGLELVRRLIFGTERTTLTDEALRVLGSQDTKPKAEYAPLENTKDGDVEALVLDLARHIHPQFARAVARFHPHVTTPEQMPALAALAGELRRTQGASLAGFNLLYVGHQTGGIPGWLSILERDLGLVKGDYLGVSVPYSGSAIAIERLNDNGFTTRATHDERPAPLQALDVVRGHGPDFETLKKASVERALVAMLDKHAANGKPILVIDDGGYVVQVLREKFKDREKDFVIVEWTTRGVRRFEVIHQPGYPFVSAAESAPKTTIEPPFIAAALLEHFTLLMKEHHGDLTDKAILVVGYGNIGRAVALALKGAGALVSVHDKEADKRRRARTDRMRVEHDLREAVRGKHGILSITGTHAITPAIFNLIDGDTVVASGSSSDIEAKGKLGSGHWAFETLRLRAAFSPEGGASSQVLRGSPAGRAFLETMERHAAGIGMKAALVAPRLAASGFPINLSRRVRGMPQAREELILMNVTEAVAQASLARTPGKQMMEPQREQRIGALFQKHHPEEYAFSERQRT